MIVAMKKIHLIVQKKDSTSALEALREMGSVHVEHQEELTGQQLEARREEVDILERAITILKASEGNGSIEPKEASDPDRIVGEILDLTAEIDACKEAIAKRRLHISQWEVWGDFSPKDIEELSGRGVYLQLCAVPKGKKNDIPEGVILKTIYSSSGIDRCVAVSDREVELPFDVIPLPSASLEEIKAQQSEDEKKIEATQKQMGGLGCYLASLEKAQQERREVLGFEEVEKGMRADEVLVVLKGFSPAEDCAAIEERAKKEGWGVIFEDPTLEDKVPTLVRNPKWISLIKPVFNFIDIAPGYKEYDISLFFLLFFSLFVGMLIGDAGYGVLFILAVAFAHFKLRHKLKDFMPIYLAYVLSGCVVAWGVLTGTFFGQQWLDGTFVQPVLPWLKSNQNIQLFCFVMGGIHLSLAHIWRMIMKFPSASFLSDAGWLALLWGMFAMARTLILGAALSSFGINLLIVGSLLVLFFTKPNWNPLKAIGPGLGDLALNVVNTFTDIVSYIRLFAVGLATVAVADATNTMAAEVGGLWFILIILIGHTINIILALMAILVHGLRLNVLEFSGHLNMEWAGFNYAPFKKIKNA